MAALEFNRILLSNADYLKPFAINLTRDAEDAKDPAPDANAAGQIQETQG